MRVFLSPGMEIWSAEMPHLHGSSVWGVGPLWARRALSVFLPPADRQEQAAERPSPRLFLAVSGPWAVKHRHTRFAGSSVVSLCPMEVVSPP